MRGLTLALALALTLTLTVNLALTVALTLTLTLNRRGLAVWVLVQNCSDQMTSKVCANIFSGLAQTGAWGCFDEFNRIAVEVPNPSP